MTGFKSKQAVAQAKLNDDDDIQDYEIYTTPPAQRTWVGLTDDELLDLATSNYINDLDLMRRVQAKLKEKNT